MADNISQSQHIAELDFDISKIYSQMAEIERVLISEGTKIQDIIKGNWKIGDVLNDNSSLNKQANQVAEQLKKHNDLSQKAKALEAEKQQIIRQTYSINEKAYTLSNKLSSLKNKDATSEKQKLEVLKDQSDELVKQLQLNGKLTDEQKEQLNIMQRELQETQNSMAKISSVSGGSKYTMLDRLKSYASYGAYSAVTNLGRNAFETVKDIEYSVMEISRVMQLNSDQTLAFKQRLFDLSKEYGRAFEDVTEVSLRYAQAGYDQQEVIEMTKSSLLALNTAELDVQNSTNSMIGILQQWNLDATELQHVIDKLNYTADNNAITTQDLVDGLLRASSAAKNAKMSFNDTIGTLTAMKEASGRTGKEVGNALNSIIAYVQRNKSLNVFEGLGIKVYADETRQSFVPILDMLGQLSEKIATGGDSVIDTLMKQTELTELYSEDLAIAAGAENEYSKAIESTNEANKAGLTDVERKSALELAGMHRRNYFIALLSNFNKIQKVSTDLVNADGYSMLENAKHMETLQAKLNQLVTSLKELAVQLADAGAMELAKDIIDTATAISGLIKNTGGLKNALLLVLGVMLMIKREKWAASIETAMLSVGKCIPVLRNYVIGLESVQTAQKSTATTATAMGVKINSALGVLGLAITAFSLVSGAISAYNQKQEEARQQAIENAKASQEEYEKLQGLIPQYETLGSKTSKTAEEKETLKDIQEQLVTLYGAEADGIDVVNGKYQDQLDKLKELNVEQLKQLYRTQKIANDETGNDDLFKQDKSIYYFESLPNYKKFLEEAEELNGVHFEKDGILRNLLSGETGYTVNTWDLSGMKEMLDLMDEYGYQNTELYKSINNNYTKTEPKVKNYIEGLKAEIEAGEKLGKSQSELAIARSKLSYLSSQFLTKEQQMFEKMTGEEKQRYLAEEMARKQYEQTILLKTGITENTEDQAQKTAELTTEYENLTKQLSTSESGISSLNKVMDSLNQGQVLSADQILDLVENYGLMSSAIKVVEGGYTVEKGALEELRQAKIKEATDSREAQIQNKIATLQATIDRTSAYYTEIQAIHDLATAQQALAKINSDESNAGLHISSQEDAQTHYETVEKNKKLKDGIKEIAKLYENLDLIQNKLYSKIGVSSDKTSKSTSELSNSTEKAKDSLSDMTKTYEHLNSMGIYSLQEQINYFENLRRNVKLTADEIMSVEKSLQGLYKQQIQEKLDLIDKEKDAKLSAINDVYDTEIERLNDLKNETSIDRQSEDYQEQRAKLEEELSGYRQRTGAEAREGEKKTLESIADLDKEYQRKLEDNKIDSQIKSLEKQKQNEIDIVNEKYNRIKDLFTSTNIELVATAKIFAPHLYNSFTEFFTNPFEMDLNRLKTLMNSLSGVSISASSNAGIIPSKMPTPTSTATTPTQRTANKNFTVGDKVKILASADNYGGTSTNVKIPESYKNKPNTISQIGYNGTQALLKELYSWVNISDLVKAKTGGKALEDGAIFMRKDEFVVRPDLTKWLEKKASQDSSITNNNQSRSDTHYNAPLFNIEKVEIADKADLNRMGNQVTRKISNKVAKT